MPSAAWSMKFTVLVPVGTLWSVNSTPPREFEVGGDAAVALEIPLEAERVETHAVGGVGGLEDEEHRNSVDRIFEASAEKAGKMWAGEDPSIAQAGVEDASVAASAADGVAAARPDLDFVAAFLRAGLSNDEDRHQQDQECNEGAHSLRRLRGARKDSSKTTTHHTGNATTTTTENEPEFNDWVRGCWAASCIRSWATRAVLWRATPPSSR